MTEAWEETGGSEPSKDVINIRSFYPNEASNGNFVIPDIIFSIMRITRSIMDSPYGCLFPVVFEAAGDCDCRPNVAICAKCDRFIVGNLSVGNRCYRSSVNFEFSNDPLRCTTGLSLCETCWDQAKEGNPELNAVICRTCDNYLKRKRDNHGETERNNTLVIGRDFITRYFAPYSTDLTFYPPKWVSVGGMDNTQYSDYFRKIWDANMCDKDVALVMVSRILTEKDNRKRRRKEVASRTTISASKHIQSTTVSDRERDLACALYRMNCFYTKINSSFLGYNHLWANHIKLVAASLTPVNEDLVGNCNTTLECSISVDTIEADYSPQASEGRVSIFRRPGPGVEYDDNIVPFNMNAEREKVTKHVVN